MEQRQVLSETPRRSCGWKTLGYKIGVSIILCNLGQPDVQAREALEDPGLEL